jgi:hypothetical protein
MEFDASPAGVLGKIAASTVTVGMAPYAKL